MKSSTARALSTCTVLLCWQHVEGELGELGELLSALLTIFYALPFGRAVSVEGSGGMSGELLLALTYGLVLVASGRWVWRRVVRDYGHPDEAES